MISTTYHKVTRGRRITEDEGASMWIGNYSPNYSSIYHEHYYSVKPYHEYAEQRRIKDHYGEVEGKPIIVPSIRTGTARCPVCDAVPPDEILGVFMLLHMKKPMLIHRVSTAETDWMVFA